MSDKIDKYTKLLLVIDQTALSFQLKLKLKLKLTLNLNGY